jgi:hypothetical protein
MNEALWGAIGAIVGGLLAGGAAIGAQVWAARSQAEATRQAFLHQDRVWHRDQRLEAHRAFLNQVNRLTMAIAAVDLAGASAPNGEALLAEVREVVARTVDAFNRVELVVSPSTYALGVKILEAADERLQDPAKFAAVIKDIGDASHSYREAAKAELKA